MITMFLLIPATLSRKPTHGYNGIKMHHRLNYYERFLPRSLHEKSMGAGILLETKEKLLILLALLDEALIIVLVVLSGIWLAQRYGLVSPLEAAIAVSPLALFLAIAAVKAFEAFSRPPAIGVEALQGKEGFVRAVIDDVRMIVEIEGELWSAEPASESRINVGERVVVVGVKGITLIVDKVEARSNVELRG